MIKKLLAVVLCALPLFVGAQTNAKLGYVDETKFFAIPDFKVAEEAFNKEQQTYQQDLKAMEDEYTRKLTEYQQQSETLTDLARKSREDELISMQERMKDYAQRAQTALQQKQSELMAPIQEKVQTAIKAVAQENGYTYIFNLEGLIYKSDSASDITELVLKKLGVDTSAPKK